MQDCTDLDECITRFDAHLRGSARLMADITELRGKRLLCHCAMGARCHGDSIVAAFSELMSGAEVDATVMIGIFHGEVEFARQALHLSHPYQHHALSDDLRRGLAVRLQCSQQALVWHQDSTMARWALRGRVVEPAESKLHESMDVGCRRVLRGKQLLLRAIN